MAKAIDSSKHILAGLLILSFLLLILVASRQFMQPVKEHVKEIHDKKEGFKTAPTRAAECKCLPGYVPAKIPEGGFFVRFRFTGARGQDVVWYNYVNMKRKIHYELTMSYSESGFTDAKVREIYQHVMKNLPLRRMDFMSEWIPFAQKNGIEWKGNVVGPWNVAEIMDITDSDRYQCQNLNNYETKECY